MGLDMYLDARKSLYVSKYMDDSNGEIKLELPDELKGFEGIWHGVITQDTNYGIGYWRKANHIHRWFVEHCGNGVDECQDMYIEQEDLEQLLETCTKVLEDHSLAKTLLPTQDGFFFGGTDYDEYYFRDTEYTKKVCEAAIALLKSEADNKQYRYQIHYQASW